MSVWVGPEPFGNHISCCRQIGLGLIMKQILNKENYCNLIRSPNCLDECDTLRVKESAEQSLFYRQDKMEESPGSTGQGAR